MVTEKLDAARSQYHEICGKLKEAADMLDMVERIAAGTYIQDMVERENENKISGYIIYSLNLLHTNVGGMFLKKQDSQELTMKKLTLTAWANILYRKII